MKLAKRIRTLVVLCVIMAMILLLMNKPLVTDDDAFDHAKLVQQEEPQPLPDTYLPYPKLFLLPHDENSAHHRYDDRLGIDKFTGIEKGPNETQHQGSGVTMEEYIMSYNRSQFHVCGRQFRPDQKQIHVVKDAYQNYITPVTGFPDTDVYLLNFYYDDRFRYTGHTHVRSIVSIRAVGATKGASQAETKRTRDWKTALQHKTEFHLLLWYDGFANPLSVTCKLNGAAGLARNIANTYYNQYSITCPLPHVDMLPIHVSNAIGDCSEPKTYLPVVYPRPPRSPASRDIGVCMASLYGKLTQQDVPYFVNWMETLNLLGVSEVTMNNALMHLDPMMVRALKYYHDKGRLFMTSYPVAHPGKWSQPNRDDAATESINKVTTSDCFYRNMRRYWWTLIIDLDEIPVPMTKLTYQEFLQDYLARNPQNTNAHCLTIRSAFFYLTQRPGNPQYGDHLPVLRYTKRFEPEPMGAASHDGIGIAKSFHNPRNVVASGHHIARATHDLTQDQMKRPVMPVDEILIHHYRKQCKYGDDCKAKWNSTITDNIIPEHFAKSLKERVETVLNQIEFFHL